MESKSLRFFSTCSTPRTLRSNGSRRTLYSRRTLRGRVTCVLAPTKPSSAGAASKEVASSGHEHDHGTIQAGMRSAGLLADRFWGSLRFWETHESQQPGDGDLLTDTAVRAKEVTEYQGSDASTPPPDISSFLQPAGLLETRFIRMLSSLCAQTYYISTLSPRSLFRRHRLNLVTTSLACELVTAYVPRTASEWFEEGDAMAASTAGAEAFEDAKSAAALATLAKLDKADAKKAKPVSAAELVASKLSAAAAAAASAAAPLASNLNTLTSSIPLKSVTAQLQSAAAAGYSTSLATIATVTAAVQSTVNGEKGKKDQCTSPTEWFVCDDPSSYMRYFVIQGSDNLDHWRVNLTFDPVQFEDAALGVKVHRGVYEAAQQLYERFLPLVIEHVSSSPFAKVAFTGHSLGGSLATLLMLMYVRRGVLPPVAIAPVYTFGAPAILCESCVCGTSTCGLDGREQPCQCSPDHGGKTAPGGLLERLGMGRGMVRNVIMHKDIVPRAFACDYSSVADLLARVGPAFKEHGCLQNSKRQVLYYFLGKTLVLQPDGDSVFVAGEGYHPMLPTGPGLYNVCHLPAADSREAVQGSPEQRKAASQNAVATVGGPQPGASMASNIVSAPSSLLSPRGRAKLGSGEAGEKAGRAGKLGPPVNSLVDAVMALMDCPHPLEMLADKASYGDDGAISRYHNPDNYTRALGGVVRSRTRNWRHRLSGRGAAGLGGPRWYMHIPYSEVQDPQPPGPRPGNHPRYSTVAERLQRAGAGKGQRLTTYEKPEQALDAAKAVSEPESVLEAVLAAAESELARAEHAQTVSGLPSSFHEAREAASAAFESHPLSDEAF